MKRWTIFGALGAAALFLGLFAVPPLIDRLLNQVLEVPLPSVSEPGRRLHATLDVADLHADPLLWQRNLLARADHGHVDVPRLIEGNVAIQVFSAPTQVPLGLNYDANELNTDMVTTLAFFQRWPRSTWSSPLERAIDMARRLDAAAAESEGRFRVLKKKGELRAYLSERTARPVMTAGVLSIEGMHAMEGKLENLDRLHAAGFRMMGLTHFFDNEIGGSAHGIGKGALTDLGRAAIRRMEEMGIIVDIAHASPSAVDEVLASATRPVVVSHGGVKGTCDTVRNLSDEHLRAVARTGGVIGIGYWDAAICDVSVAGVVKAIRHALAIAGPDHVGLGSDFDGATHTPFDTSALAVITDGLLAAGVEEETIRKVMGGNVLRVLEASGL